MLRCLKEFRIRGVKTNILFLENVLQHPQFTDGSYSTKFVDDNTDLFIFPKTHDRGTKLLNYIADISINGYSNVGVQPKPEFAPLNMPSPLSVRFLMAANRFLMPMALQDWQNGYRPKVKY